MSRDDADRSGVGGEGKSVRWDAGADSGSSEDERVPPAALRRQSLVGTSGYVGQLLEQSLEEDREEEEREKKGVQKPLRRQSRDERRDTVRAAARDLDFLMKEALQFDRRKSMQATRSESRILSTLTDEDKAEVFGGVPAAKDRLSSDWVPSHVLETEGRGRTEISWLGTYVVGKDYWAEKESGADPEQKVTYGKDEENVYWYNMPLQRREGAPASVLQSVKHRFLEKFDILKDEIDQEFQEKKKQRMISAAHAREVPPAAEEWSQEFRQCFRDVCRSADRPRRISLLETEWWLERAHLLDHSRLTTLHTALCFKAAGGSRFQDLDFDQFTEFLQMITPAIGLSVQDLAKRITACRRKAGG